MSAPEFTATSYPIRLYLARNRREWNGLMKRWDRNWFYPDVDLNASFTQIAPGVYVIAITPHFKDLTLAKQVGTIAHEATHVWQSLAEYIKEDSRAHESNAYNVQAIVEWAIDNIVN